MKLIHMNDKTIFYFLFKYLMDNNVIQFLQLNDLLKQKKRSVNRMIQPTINKLLSIFNNEIRNYTKKDTEIVIAKYNENVEWFNMYDHLTTIYNKSERDIPNMIKINNVGRESQTYLHHIITNWDNLADNTLFTQGNFSQDHKPYPIEVYLVKKNIKFFAHLYKTGVFFRNGNGNNLKHAYKWLDEYNNGDMKHAVMTFSDFWSIFSENKINYNKIIWSHGAIFSVNKEIIKNKPLGFYIYLNNIVNTHRNPEEGHYFERCWYYIFNTVISPNNRLYEIYTLLEQNYEIKKTNELNKVYWNNLNKINIFMMNENENKRIREKEEMEKIKQEEIRKKKEIEKRQEEEKKKQEYENKMRELKKQEHILQQKKKEEAELERNKLKMTEEKKRTKLKQNTQNNKLEHFLEYKYKLKKIQLEKDKANELRKLKKIQQNLKNNNINIDEQKLLHSVDFNRHITEQVAENNLAKEKYENNSHDNFNEKNILDTENENLHHTINNCISSNEDLYLKYVGIKEQNINKIFENNLYSIGKI